MLYQLSYASVIESTGREMERETRIELATNSLEGCDSTIELLPRSDLRLHFTLRHRVPLGVLRGLDTLKKCVFV